VLDTNVVLDWLLFREPAVGALAAAVEGGRLRWLACASMRDELAHVVVRGQFAAWKPDLPTVLAVFDRHAVLHEAPPPQKLPCTDPDDQPYIDLALHAQARWLFSRDRAVLALARRARLLGLTIRSPLGWQET